APGAGNVQDGALRRVPEVAPPDGARLSADGVIRGNGRVDAAGGRAGALQPGAPAAQGSRRARAGARVLPWRHLAELPRQVSRVELPAQEDGVGLGQAGARRGEARPVDVSDGRTPARARQARALSRAVQLRLLARAVRRALPQLPA